MLKLQLCVCTMLLPTLAAFGQDQLPSSKKYVGMDVPTGVAFYGAVGLFRYQVEEGDSNDVVEEIQSRLKVDFNTADDLLVLLVEAAMAIDADSDAINSALACLDGDPYEILAQAYDVREDVGMIHYERFKKRLDKVTAWYLEDWMADSKYGMVYGRFDYEAVYRKSGRDASADLAQRCRDASVGMSE